MLDAVFVRANLEAVKANCRNRNVRADVDRVVHFDDERKRVATQTQQVQQQQNELSKSMAQVKDKKSAEFQERSWNNSSKRSRKTSNLRS
jgi:seryl-tRNA synthetase